MTSIVVRVMLGSLGRGAGSGLARRTAWLAVGEEHVDRFTENPRILPTRRSRRQWGRIPNKADMRAQADVFAGPRMRPPQPGRAFLSLPRGCALRQRSNGRPAGGPRPEDR